MKNKKNNNLDHLYDRYIIIAVINKIKHYKYNSVRTVPKSNRKIVETNTKSIYFLVWYRHYILKGGRVTLV